MPKHARMPSITSAVPEQLLASYAACHGYVVHALHMISVLCSHIAIRGFDHLPAYIAAKLAAKGSARSPRRPRQKGQHLEMTVQSPKTR